MTNEFEVDQILASKNRKGKILYKIRWKTFGPEDDTWEPLSHLRGCQELVRVFESRNTPQVQTGPSPVIGRSSNSVIARTPRTVTKTNVSFSKSSGAGGDGLTVRERVDYSRRSLQRSALRSNNAIQDALQGSTLRSKLSIQDTPKITLTDGRYVKRTTITTKKVNSDVHVTVKTKPEDSAISPAVAILCVLLIILMLVFIYFTS